jgi:hypothetical protein
LNTRTLAVSDHDIGPSVVVRGGSYVEPGVPARSGLSIGRDESAQAVICPALGMAVGPGSVTGLVSAVGPGSVTGLVSAAAPEPGVGLN